MLSDLDAQAMMQAAQSRLQIAISYLKATNGEIVTHTGGIVEINSEAGLLWLWDTTTNDHIRKFYLANIQSLQVLQMPFDNASAGGYPLKINGQIVLM